MILVRYWDAFPLLKDQETFTIPVSQEVSFLY